MTLFFFELICGDEEKARTRTAKRDKDGQEFRPRVMRRCNSATGNSDCQPAEAEKILPNGRGRRESD